MMTTTVVKVMVMAMVAMSVATMATIMAMMATIGFKCSMSDLIAWRGFPHQ